MALGVSNARVELAQESFLWGADAGNPLPDSDGFSFALPPDLPFRRVYLAAYCRDDTLCQAEAVFTLWHHGDAIFEHRLSMLNGAVNSVAAGVKSRNVYAAARAPFTILDSSPGTYRDTTEAAPDALRFVWRSTRDIQAVVYPIRLTVEVDKLTMRWAGGSVVTASTVLAVAAAAVISSNYP